MTEVTQEQVVGEVEAEVVGATEEQTLEGMEEVVEMTLVDKFTQSIKEITNCNDDQANTLITLLTGLIGQSLDYLIHDQNVLGVMYNNMMRVQVNNNERLQRYDDAQARLDYIVLDEAHPVSELRVTYASEDVDSWVFERPVKDGWEEVRLGHDARNNLVTLAGKFFNGRVGHTGYIVEVGAMKRYDKTE